jgi:hypothetical protein
MTPAIGMKLSRSGAKALFFDRKRVQNAMDRRTRQVFGRFGAATRLDAKRSLRKRKSGKPSAPGQPPRSRTGVLRKSIYYAADLGKRSVVIGPVRLSKGDGAPELHEHGGTARRRFILKRNPRTGKLEPRFRAKAKPRTVRYEPRPFMGPAAERTKDRLPEFWASAERRS